MTPQLNLVYNSQSGNGVIGKGWSINGWSYVGRVAESIYFDGAPGSIDFQDDGFELDGNRLIIISQSNSEYRTEVDGGAKISFITTGMKESSNSYWKVQTKDGLSRYYGSTDQSRQNNGGNTLSIRWHLSKIEDMAGNYIEYEYDRIQSTGEIYLQKIIYSKNSNNGADNSVFYSVNFNYYELTDSKFWSTSYFTHGTNNSYQYSVRRQLQNITVSFGTTLLSKYNLSYQHGLFGDYYLIAINVTNDAQSLLPTTFKWSLHQGIINVDDDLQHTFDVMDYSKNGVSGDFNGDGISDVAVTAVSGNDLHTDVYLSNQPGTPSTCYRFPNLSGFKFVGDINGDGLDELLVEKHDKTYIIRYNNENYTFSIETTLNEKPRYIGDFNGDGLSDLITSIGNTYFIRFGNAEYVSFINSIKNLEIPSTLFQGQGNFVGTSKVGLIGIEGNQLKHYFISQKNENTYQATITHTFTMPSSIQFRDYGDFNGDGRDDILLGKNGLTYICYSYGMGFKPEQLLPNIENYWWGEDNRYLLADVNLDGICDIIITRKEQNRTAPEIKFNYRVYFKHPGTSSDFTMQTRSLKAAIEASGQVYTYKYDILALLFGNFAGYGYNDIFILQQIDAKDELYNTVAFGLYGSHSTYSGVNDSRITSISDGPQLKETSIEYSRARFEQLAPTPTNISYPLKINRYPITVIHRIENKDVYLGNKYIKSYLWFNFITHQTGKGGLGFSCTIEHDLKSNVKIESSGGILVSNGLFYYPFTESINITSGLKLLSVTKNTVEAKQTQLNVNQKIFIPITTKSYSKNWDIDGTYKGITMVKQDLLNVDQYGNLKMKEEFKDEWKIEPEGSDWNWQTQYWTYYNHKNEEGRWYSQLESSVTQAKSYELEEWKFVSNEYEHYNNGQLKSVKSIAGYNQFNSPLVKKRSFVYDIYGNITSDTLSAPNDKMLPPRVTVYEYGSIYNGRYLTKETVKGQADICTIFDYYGDKGLLKEKRELCNPATGLSSIITKYEYDSFGNITKTINPDGTMSIREVTWAGASGREVPSMATVKVNSFNQTTNNQIWNANSIYLDENGNILRSVVQNLQGTKVFIDKKYDGYGRLIEISEPYSEGSPTNLKTMYDYDYYLGRLATVTLPDGSIIKNTYKGRAIKTKNMTSEVWSEKTVNAIGLIDLVVDTLGIINTNDIINNNYDGLGRLINTIALGKTTSIEYDIAGNQSKLIEPNTGTTSFEYNAYGELVNQTDANGNYYEFKYLDGRPDSKTITNGTETVSYDYVYNLQADQNGFGQLFKESCSNGTEKQFMYDELGRIIQKTETINQNTFTFDYTYNSTTGMLETYEYPSGFRLKFVYNSRGSLLDVLNDANDEVLWEAILENQRGQLTHAWAGNGIITENGYDIFGFPEVNKVRRYAEVIQHFAYQYNPTTGNLTSRTDLKREITEVFEYDNHLKNLLTYWGSSGGEAKTMDYGNNGNILHKSDVASDNNSYRYENQLGKPHAVSSILEPTDEFKLSTANQDIKYSVFNKVEHIISDKSPGGHQLRITYGPDNKRKLSFYNYLTDIPSVPRVLKYFLDNYEYEYRDSEYRHIHYLNCSEGLFAIMVKQGTTETIYYVNKDNLGSITSITNKNGILLESLSYDPWGRRRNPDNWNDFNVTSSLFDRGFTGHEHLDQFRLINMNGRMYDPFLARFLSPDPFVQQPDNSQNYNRYSYAWNNPLKYTDPSGEFIHLVIGAALGGVINWLANGAQFNAAGLGNFGVGALGGALGAGIGAGFGALASGAGHFSFMSSAALGAQGFGAGAAAGFGAGFTGGLITGTGNSLIKGENIGKSISQGINSAFWGGALGGLSGGITGGIRAARAGRDFWSGNGIRGKYDLRYDRIRVGMVDNDGNQINNFGRLSKMDNSVPFYTDSHLEFNGSNLEYINNYCDGSQCVSDTWEAVSGPYGNGALPNGNYLGDNLRIRSEYGYIRDGVGFSMDMEPLFQTTRTLLRIHPDGGISGTLGCIGIQENASRLNIFYNSLSTYFDNISPSIRIMVY